MVASWGVAFPESFWPNFNGFQIRVLERIFCAGLAFSDTVGSTVAPVLGKSRCTNPEVYASMSEMQYIKRLCNLSRMSAARQSLRDNKKQKNNVWDKMEAKPKNIKNNSYCTPILSQTLFFLERFFFCFVVFPHNCYRPGLTKLI